MEDGNSDKERLQAQVKALRSGNKRSIIEALDEIRKGSEVFIIKDLAYLLEEQEDPEICTGITALLSDMKIQEAVPILIECIQDDSLLPIQNQVVAACWQNGLNYGEYAFVFARLVLDAPLETAIEALTVFEECIGDLEDSQKAELIREAEEKAVHADESHSGLISAMLKMINSY